MQLNLPYGTDSAVSLELADDALVAHCRGPRGDAIADRAEAVRAALEDPLEMPPLKRVVVPGDHVVLAIDPDAVAVADVVAVVTEQLIECGIEPQHITCLRTPSGRIRREDPRSRLDEGVRRAVRLEEHQPTSRAHLSYLAVDSEDHPVYLNRTLVDADVVLPIGCLRPRPDAAQQSVHGCFFPSFSDQETQRRFHTPEYEVHAPAARVREEVDQVGWLLGVHFTIQVVGGGRDEVVAVLAGEPSAVMRRGRELRDEAWRFEVPRSAGIVLAAIAGDASQQTWENVGRALAAASEVVEPGGAIAVCCDLAQPPGPAIARLADADDPWQELSDLNRQDLADLRPALQLAEAVRRGPVYLLSRLDPDVVEDLGMTAIAKQSELQRLVSRFDSCIVLSNAQDTTAQAAAGV